MTGSHLSRLRGVCKLVTLRIDVRYGYGQAVMRIRLNNYTDPDPGSGNPPYKSGSKEKTSHKIQFFKIL